MPAKTILFSLEHDEVKQMADYLQHERISFQHILCAAWAVLLARYAGEESVEVWHAPAPDSSKHGASLVVNIDKGDTFCSLITRTAGNAALPDNGEPFYWGLVKPDLQLDDPFTLYDLALHGDGGGAFSLQYDSMLHEPWFVQQIAGHLRLILLKWLKEPACEVYSFPLLTDAESELILDEWNRTETPFPDDTTLHRMFEEQAEKNPDAIALVCRNERLTYRELNSRANRLAHAIRAYYRTLRDRDILPDTPIGICMGRSVGMIVTMLGILKAGAVYVPLDPDYPRDRLRFMMDDAVAPLVITELDMLEKLLFLNELDYGVISLDGGWEFISRFPDTNPEPVSGPGNLAYIIYTSGSTGRPKGVMITHLNAVNFTCNEIAIRNITRGDKILEFASINFDAAVTDIYPALLSGATLHIAHDEIRKDPEALFRYYREHAFTGTTITPVVLHAMPKESLPDLKAIVVGGDVCNDEDVRFWSQGRKLINAYGPTECTVIATELVFNEHSRHSEIGRPISNVKAYILDSSMNPVPVGVAGELYIGGVGVGRGYLNRQELTRERFIANPFATRQERDQKRNLRLYRTGDRVRWQPSGSIDFLGRVDFQVKIRGFRIEPGEIEAMLSLHSEIKECAVVPYDDGGEKRLAAYIVPVPDHAPALAQLRAHLKQQLPDYMIPSVFVQMEALPLSPSRKIDRQALPAPDEFNILKDSTSPRHYCAPRTQQEERVAQIVRQIMNMERISVTDDLFDLGAHSLTAARMATEIRKQFAIKIEIRDIFANPTIEKLSVRIYCAPEKGHDEEVIIPRAAHRHYIPLTFQQEQVWFLSRLVPNNRAYNAQVAIRLLGELDTEILCRTLDEIIRRHEILRTTFHESNYGPVQVVHAPWKATAPLVDLAFLSPETREQEADRLMEVEICSPFDYTRLPLVKWKLYRMGEQEHLLLHMEHHFVHDGWEVSVFFNELKILYTAFKESKPSPLPKLPIQYADYAIWQHRYLSGSRLEDKIDYWINRINDYPHILNMPQDRSRPLVQSFNGAMIRLDMKEGYHHLREFSRLHKVTLFDTMFSAFAVLLAKYTRQQKFLVGTGVANRNLKETEIMLGMFVNTVLLCPDLSANPTFIDLIRTTKDSMLKDAEHYDLPFKHIVERLKAGSSPGRNPLFQTLFAFHDSAVPYLDFAGLNGRIIIKHNATAKTDINVICIPRAEQHAAYKEGRPEDEELSILWEYNSDLFDRETMQGMLDHYVALLKQVIRHPEQRVMEIDFLLPFEREKVIYGFNATAFACGRDKTVHGRFLEQVAQCPDKAAVIHNGRVLTYQELNRRVHAAASRLRQCYREKCGMEITPDTPVGLCCKRSPEMVVGMLAILRAGGAYLPLPTSYPPNRLRYIMEDAGIQVVFTSGQEKDVLPVLAEQGRILLSMDNDQDDVWPASEPEGAGNPDSIAYIIYTSGSTGNPKGVCISHRAVNNFVQSMQKEFIACSDVIAQCANYAFDASVFEIWGALLTGATLVIIDSTTIEDFDMLLHEMEQHQISTAFFTTALFNAIVDCNPEVITRLRRVYFGGEAANPACVRKLLTAKPDTLSVVNVYGPTECTCYSTLCLLSAQDIAGERIPIGRPLSNYTAYLLDERMNPVPVGVPGELYIGGDSLARGYLNRPELTADRFVNNPFAVDAERAAGINTRLYKTGDLMLRRDNGHLEFLGRVDFQVKIRGFRIEPEEIETALLRHDAVKQCVVIPWEQNLVAYWVAQEPDTAVTTESLKSFLGASLPDFMVPSAFIKMVAFQLNSSYKIDRTRLPSPRLEDMSESRSEYLAPTTRTEQAVQEIWRELLKRDRISINDSFFEIGGNSIMTVRMLSAIKRRLGLEVNLSQMFALPTIRGIAACIDGTGITTGTADNNLTLALRDARTKVEVNWSVPDSATTGGLLLTGATGFLGIYMLDTLLAETTADIFCLIRSNFEPEQRFDDVLAFYGKGHLRDNPRIKLLKADLEEPGLGLEPDNLTWLQDNLEGIWHCGALVHHLYDYGRLRKTNVQATIELLKLAASGRKKHFNYISTLGTASIRNEDGRTMEVDVSSGPISTNGYTLSKWVCEQILTHTAAQGMQINIFRPGNITGDSITGICKPEVNHTLLRIKGCLQIKVAPDWKRTTEMVPVDLLARAMVKLSAASKGLNIYNMNNPYEISWREYVAFFKNSGFSLKFVPETLWLEKYLSNISETNALYPIRGFYTKAQKESAHRDVKPFSRWNSIETLQRLQQLGICYPDNYKSYMKTVIAWLVESGFLADLQEQEGT